MLSGIFALPGPKRPLECAVKVSPPARQLLRITRRQTVVNAGYQIFPVLPLLDTWYDHSSWSLCDWAGTWITVSVHCERK